MSITTLGINCAHDAAAAVLVDGELRVAIAEERLSRVKHHEGFPGLAIEYCLAEVGLSDLGDVDCIVVNEYVETDHSEGLRRSGYAGVLHTNPSHHLLHALHAVAASGFEDTAVMILDGSGYAHYEYVRKGGHHLGPAPSAPWMEESYSTYAFRDGEIDVVTKGWGDWEESKPYYRFPSLGHMFSMASQYIFGHMHHAGKTMGLAPFGDPAGFPVSIVELTASGVEVDTSWIHRLPARSDRLPIDDRWCRDLAARVQVELEAAVLHLARLLHKQTDLPRLCVSGGVALNSVTNAILRKDGPFDEVFVTPAAGDSGVAVGAAIHGHERATGVVPRWGHRHDAWGRRYTSDDVDAAVKRFDRFVDRSTVDDPAAAAAQDLADGRIIGWFDGPSELGPRALGHRSILADPRPVEVARRLTDRVKFREPFRPYAASVLAEHAGDWFDTDWDDEFMLSVVTTDLQRRERIPNVSHVDGTSRIQTVPDTPGNPYRRLIEAFADRTGVPMVLNTSFNIRGEPMVETPEDAVRCFLSSDLDVLYLEGLRITKVRATPEVWSTVVPMPAEELQLVSSRISSDLGWDEVSTAVVTRTGHRVALTDAESCLLRRLDGSTLAALLPDVSPAAIELAEGLQRRGIVWLAR